jgi:broad specificity phosphatase PhoE
MTHSDGDRNIQQSSESADHTRLVLVRAGKTDWSDQQRIQGNTDLPLSNEGTEEVNRWIEELKRVKIDLVYSSSVGPPAETARRISKALKIKHRTQDDLAEIDLGLWQGMSIDDFKQKHAKVYKQWIEQPGTVVAPEGECVNDAQRRLAQAIEKIIDRNKGRCTAVVLGQISLALARRTREDWPMTEVWKRVREPLAWYEYHINSDTTEK